MDPLSAGIGAAGGVIGGIANAIGGARAQKKQNEHDLKMWHLNNEYNSPTSQMERYREAGLNPNLIYGNGSSSAGNSTSAPTQSSKRQFDAQQTIGSMLNFTTQMLQMDKLQKDTDIAAETAFNERLKRQIFTNQADQIKAQTDSILLGNVDQKYRNKFGLQRYALENLRNSSQIQLNQETLRGLGIDNQYKGRIAESQLESAEVLRDKSRWDVKQAIQNYNFNKKANPFKLNELSYYQNLRNNGGVNKFTNSIYNSASSLLDLGERQFNHFIKTFLGGKHIKDAFRNSFDNWM